MYLCVPLCVFAYLRGAELLCISMCVYVYLLVIMSNSVYLGGCVPACVLIGTVVLLNIYFEK